MFLKKPIAFSCCLLALCLFFNRIYAQTSTPAVPQFALRTDLIPPSPNAASLGKFGAVPVSLNTGVPNISIPLTEAVGKQLKVPVTLNYHNNGFKPTEEASWVGLGWSLDAGGVITRTVKDKVDGDIFVGPNGQYDHVDWRFHQPDSITQAFLDQVMWNQSYDVEPDIYTYNFGGRTGKFIIYNNVVYQYPYQQLTIFRETAVDGFTIITPEGNTYRFWQPETTTTLNKFSNPDRPNYTPPNPFTSSWYLQTITSADLKDVITFSYSAPQIIPQEGPASQTLTINVTDPLWGYDLSQLQFQVPTRVNSLLLTGITTSKMHIDFNQNTIIRQDVTGGALDNIMVYNYQEELINKFKFNLDYFNTASTTRDTKRMRLSGIEEGLTTGKLKKHFFFYNTDLTESKSHPGVDHWGYSNGSRTDVIIPAKFYPGGANKDPDFSHANQGMLNRIVYPTGGSSVLEFEPNLYNNDHSVNYVYNDLYASLDANRADTTTTNIITQSTSIVINEAQMVYINYTRNPKAIYTPVGAGPETASKNFTDDVTINPGAHNYKITKFGDDAGKADSAYLTAGTYTVVVTCDDRENDISAVVHYKQKTSQVIEGNAGPGIRIKRITNYTGFLATGTPSSVKEYIYKDSLGVSNGILLNIPDYGGKDYKEIQPIIYGTGGPVSKQYRTYFSANANGYNASQPMFYKTVYEKQVNGSEYLLSRSDFGAASLSGASGAEVFLTIKTDFKKTGSVYNKVARHIYNYSTVVDSSFFYIKPFNSQASLPFWFSRVYTYDFFNFDIFWMRLDSEKTINYYNTSDTLVTTKTYVYDAKPRNPVLITTNDSKGTTLVEKNKYSENYVSSIGYPFTVRYVTAPVIEKQQWLKRSATDSVLTSAVITSYDASLLKPVTLYAFKSLAPVSSLNQETKTGGLYNTLLSDNTNFESRINNFYDGNGNLISQDMTGSDGNSQVSYLWGYHNNYPIAQVKNTIVSSVAYTSFEDDDTSWPYTAANVVTTDARTGLKCYTGTMTKSGLPSGNYTVSLWAKGSGTVTVGGVAKTITASWQVYDWALTGVTSVTVNSNGNKIDEVRLLPANAMMNTYTYKPEVGVLSITDTKGLTQFYEYDDMKRLLNIRDQDGNILKNYTYNYAVPQPIWVDTYANYQCVQGPNGNTGEQLKQQRDNNPLSPTYNQFQMVSNGINTSQQGGCPIPITVYVQMFSGGSTQTNGRTYSTYVFKAFSDANYSVPVNVPFDVVVNYYVRTHRTFYDGRPDDYVITNSTVTIAAGTNQATTPSIYTSGCTGFDTKMICVSAYPWIQEGDGYIPYIVEN